MSDYSQALWDATSQLYDVFSAYRDSELEVDWQANLPNYDILTTKALSDLSVSDFTPLLQQIPALDNADQILRRFLPRILELSIDGYHRWSIGLESVFATLQGCDWRTWSETEQVSIETFMRAFWLHHLHDVSPTGTRSSADTILEAIAQVMNVQAFLDLWSDMSNTSATAHLASLIVYGKKHLIDVRHWLSQPNILQRIEAAFWDCASSDHAAMFAKAAEYLRLADNLVPA